MSKKRKNMPELRFPEFRGQDEWVEEKLNKIYSFKVTNSFSRDKLNYHHGTVKNIHYGDIHTKFSNLFDIEKETVPYINPSISLEKIKLDNYCVEGDMIFADASEDLDGVGESIEVINLNNEKLLSGLHTLLARQKEKKLIKGFGGYLFKSPTIRNRIKKESQGAKVLGISAGRLSNIDIFFPKDEKEQQKIAECFSSIDNLIENQSRKVEALKEHKKGLMQILFPKDGESTPEFRFPGVWNEGTWKEEELLESIDVIDGDRGKNYPKAEDFSKSGYCVFLNAKNVTKNGFKFDEVHFISQDKDEVLKKGKLKTFDIILTTRGSVGNFAFFDTKVPYENMRINSGMVILRIKSKKLLNQYLYYYCNSSFIKRTIEQIAFGNAQQQLTVAQIKKLKLYYPKDEKEQQKIAECFSSIDNLIENQSRKVEALKEHKKGLMQILFPNNEESR